MNQDDGRPKWVKKVENAFEFILYSSRLILLVPIIFLTFGLVWYIYHQISLTTHHVIEIITATHVVTGVVKDASIILFEMIELVLTTHFVLMLNIGTYNEMISIIDFMPNLPGWLKHLTTNTLKIKLGASIIGLSSIHLMAAFVDDTITPEVWQKKLWIHTTISASTLVVFIIVGLKDVLVSLKSIFKEKKSDD